MKQLLCSVSLGVYTEFKLIGYESRIRVPLFNPMFPRSESRILTYTWDSSKNQTLTHTSLPPQPDASSWLSVHPFFNPTANILWGVNTAFTTAWMTSLIGRFRPFVSEGCLSPTLRPRSESKSTKTLSPIQQRYRLATPTMDAEPLPSMYVWSVLLSREPPCPHSIYQTSLVSLSQGGRRLIGSS